ncbi:toxin-antitoxin system YwqK family antitoxin [Pedobacter insulae]|uniref:MORN repeat variant n=1 Tax=Pedobacter insulae TaxID=414048 RepID=A0A1I2SQK8_9SPHI|nr:hypothetical protein [Pedobacter insulae]SFG55030.1 MORN repeat variant [Pedobacter insulae]
MKRTFLLLFFLFNLHIAYAQQVDNYRQDTTTLYQRTKGFYSDPMRSKWKQELKQEGDAWVLSLYNRKKVLQEKITFTDQNLEERRGPYAFYKNGHIKEEGNYDKGYKHGEWKYYDANAQLAEKVTYSWDKLHGASVTYWDNGQLKASKNYVKGIKVGECKFYYKDGKIALNEVYDENGSLVTGAYFDEHGKAVGAAYVNKVFD